MRLHFADCPPPICRSVGLFARLLHTQKKQKKQGTIGVKHKGVDIPETGVTDKPIFISKGQSQ